MPGHPDASVVGDGHPVFDLTIHDQVTALLGDDRTRSLLLMMRSLVMMLAGLGDTSLLSPAGLASIHRLKSEAGLMGFIQLSHACDAFDDLSQGASPQDQVILDLRSSIASTLLVTGELMGPVELGCRASSGTAYGAGSQDGPISGDVEVGDANHRHTGQIKIADALAGYGLVASDRRAKTVLVE